MDIITTNLENIRKTIITVCVGSSCHLKGSYEVIEFLTEVIRERKLERDIVLKGCFCMEKCAEGVNVQVNDKVFAVASVDEMREIFQKTITHTEDNSDNGGFS